MSLKPQQELEIYPLLDRVLELPVGKAILHECTLQRANYLTRIIKGLRYDLAIESIVTYDSTSPFYGLGVYANIWIEAHTRGLLITVLADPADSTMWRIIKCRATEEPQQLEATMAVVNQLLFRVKKKYPEIMSDLWAIKNNPIIINYAKKEKEQIIVDIDINPGGNIHAPTQEEIVKART